MRFCMFVSYGSLPSTFVGRQSYLLVTRLYLSNIRSEKSNEKSIFFVINLLFSFSSGFANFKNPN